MYVCVYMHVCILVLPLSELHESAFCVRNLRRTTCRVELHFFPAHRRRFRVLVHRRRRPFLHFLYTQPAPIICSIQRERKYERYSDGQEFDADVTQTSSRFQDNPFPLSPPLPSSSRRRFQRQGSVDFLFCPPRFPPPSKRLGTAPRTLGNRVNGYEVVLKRNSERRTALLKRTIYRHLPLSTAVNQFMHIYISHSHGYKM